MAWTREAVVLRELPWKPGEEVSASQWDLGLARLWNTDLFSRVDAHLERDGEGSTRAIFDLEERFPLNPLASWRVGGGQWWFRLGATDINALGRFLTWGARYERFGPFNGGQAWVKDPRLFDKRLSGQLQVDFLFRPRPAYVRRRFGGTLDLLGELDDVVRAGLKLEVFHDEYQEALDVVAALPAPLTAGQLTATQRLGRVDAVRVLQRGASFELRETLGVAQRLYTQLFIEALWFRVVGERLNLAVRALGGLSSGAPPEQQFWLGGLDLVRGYADSVVRTERFVLANLEARYLAWDSTWLAVMPAAFVDGALADDGAVVTPLLSAGGGVRLLVPRFYRMGFRGDLAVTLTGRPGFGFSFSVYQFF